MAKKKSTVSAFALGAGVAAAVTGGIIAFLTQTKSGKKMSASARKQAAALAKEVTHRAEKAKKLTKKHYEEIVDEAVEEFKKKKKLTKTAAAELAAELKKEWTKVQREMKK